MRVTTRTIAALLATALVATGCGGDDEKDGANAQSSAAETVQNSGEPAPESADPGDAPTNKDSQAVLASRVSQIGEVPIRLEIVELRRSGATSAITIRLVHKGEADGSAAKGQVSDTLDDGITDLRTGNERDTNDGISLIDTANRKRYLVARDSRGRCVCDNGLSGTFVKPEAPTVLSATFGAPPANIKAVDVIVPNFGTFKNVPLS